MINLLITERGNKLCLSKKDKRANDVDEKYTTEEIETANMLIKRNLPL
jgi:hypothetical protein